MPLQYCYCLYAFLYTTWACPDSFIFRSKLGFALDYLYHEVKKSTHCIQWCGLATRHTRENCITFRSDLALAGVRVFHVHVLLVTCCGMKVGLWRVVGNQRYPAGDITNTKQEVLYTKRFSNVGTILKYSFPGFYRRPFAPLKSPYSIPVESGGIGTKCITHWPLKTPGTTSLNTAHTVSIIVTSGWANSTSLSSFLFIPNKFFLLRRVLWRLYFLCQRGSSCDSRSVSHGEVMPYTHISSLRTCSCWCGCMLVDRLEEGSCAETQNSLNNLIAF